MTDMSMLPTADTAPLADPAPADGQPIDRPLRRYGRWIIALVLTILPIIGMVLYSSEHFHNLPWGETWVYAVTYGIPVARGQFTFDMLFMQFVDHRIVTQRLLMLALIELTNWDFRWHLIITFVQAGLIVVCAAALMRRVRPALAVIMLPLAALLWFSPIIGPVWLRVYNDTIAPFMFLIIGVLWVTTARPGWRTFIVALLIAWAAALSTLNGFGVFIVLPCVAGLRGWRSTPRANLRDLAIWVGIGGVTAALYLIGLTPSRITTLAFDPVEIGRFTVGLWGAVFSNDLATASVLGLAGLLLTLVNVLALVRHHGWRTALPVIAPFAGLMLFGLMAAGLTAIGRANTYGPLYGLGQAHYTMQSLIVWTGAAGIGLLALHDLRGRGSPAPALTLGFALIGALLCSAAMMQFIESPVNRHTEVPFTLDDEQARCVRNHVIHRDETCFLIPVEERFQDWGYWLHPRYAEYADAMAVERLAGYNDAYNTFAYVPPSYRPGDRIIVDAGFSAQHIPLRTFDDVRVPETDILRIARTDQLPLALHDAVHIIADETSAVAVRAFIADAAQVWYVRPGSTAPFGNVYLEAVAAQMQDFPIVLGRRTLERQVYSSIRRFANSDSAPAQIVPVYLNSFNIVPQAGEADGVIYENTLVQEDNAEYRALRVPGPSALRLPITISAAVSRATLEIGSYVHFGSVTPNDTRTVTTQVEIDDGTTRVVAASVVHTPANHEIIVPLSVDLRPYAGRPINIFLTVTAEPLATVTWIDPYIEALTP